MSSTHRARVRRAGVLGCLVGALAALVGVPLGAAASQAAPQSPSLGLTTAVTVGTDTYVTVRMGRTGDHNLFWEVFHRHGSGPWRLVTPPGVADNGGLVTAAIGDLVLEGFLPSQALAFSPLGFSTNSGRTWSPGGINAALVHAPSAVAIDTIWGTGLGAPGDGALLALADPAHPRVLAIDGALTNWRTEVTGADLSATAALQRCRFEGLDAVGFTASGAARFGGACASPGVLGVVVRGAGGLSLARALVPTVERTDRLRVAAFTSDGALVTGIDARGGRMLAVARVDARGIYELSAPLALSRDATLIGSSASSSGTVAELWRARGTLHAAVNAPGLASRWLALSPVPSGTVLVSVADMVVGAPVKLLAGGASIAAADAPVAFVVDQARLTVEVERTFGRPFTVAQRLTVPIAYGSSS